MADEFKEEREKEIINNAKVLIKELVMGLCAPSLIDMAFNLDKNKLIKTALKEVTEELEEAEHEC